MSSKLPDGDDAAGLWTRLSAAKVRFSYRGEAVHEAAGDSTRVPKALPHRMRGKGETKRGRKREPSRCPGGANAGGKSRGGFVKKKN